nr:MAG TPA: hypothetical protein [Caudoviricetes sp.]
MSIDRLRKKQTYALYLLYPDVEYRRLRLCLLCVVH